ncbi:hypothetical protein IE81DRAFT_293964 [Ceraceosorus guamensis]|uniref:Uncharacterized protein n=1 Tax=Ceraceosorus guamensis TaxID=1522189 RepID=A0A316VSN2_9BASI|nr:hypothetical protein IE81DRAFT_293964 [Ceraceosorus guamensis]PWN40048.1 hypothetical protein IE81DRAFT_293964 [Ceraceosorus guamensis]
MRCAALPARSAVAAAAVSRSSVQKACRSYSSSATSTSTSTSTSTNTDTGTDTQQRKSRRKRAQLASRPGADLVGPAHPISNIRPLLLIGSAFEEDLHSSSSSNSHASLRTTNVSHPYSLSEFNSEGTASFASPSSSPTSSASDQPRATSKLGAWRRSFLSSPTASPNGRPSYYYLDLLSRLEAAELRHRLNRARAEALTQRFWADNNLRFGAAQDAFELEMQIAKKVERATRHVSPSSSSAFATGSDDALTPFYSSWLSANAARHRAYNALLWQHTIRDLAPAAVYQTLKVWARVVRRWERLLGRL